MAPRLFQQRQRQGADTTLWQLLSLSLYSFPPTILIFWLCPHLVPSICFFPFLFQSLKIASGGNVTWDQTFQPPQQKKVDNHGSGAVWLNQVWLLLTQEVKITTRILVDINPLLKMRMLVKQSKVVACIWARKRWREKSCGWFTRAD